MNPHERRIIHSALQEVEGVTTYSTGNEPNRKVIIAPTDLPPKDRRRGGYQGNKGGQGRRPGQRRGGPRPPRRDNAPAGETTAETTNE